MQPSNHFASQHMRLENVTLAAGDVVDAPSSDYTLCLVLAGQAQLSWRCEDRWHQRALGPGMFAPITLPHQAAMLNLSAAQRHLMLSVGESVFEDADAGDALESLTQRPFHDPFLGQLCRRAWVESQHGDALGHAFLESIEAAIVNTLLRAASGAARVRPRDNALSLSPARLRTIQDYCETHHAQRVPVSDLARLSGLPAARFSAAFKAAVGQTPQQYLMSVRAGHAKRLLTTTDLTLAEIAAECGFFDQSHMTTSFTRLLGMPPLRYRQQTRG
jgi:AraC-like DNA-binding protein